MFILLDDLLLQHEATAALAEQLCSETLRLAAEVGDKTLAYVRLRLLENGEFIEPHGEAERRALCGLDMTLKDLDLMAHTLHAQAERELREARDDGEKSA